MDLTRLLSPKSVAVVGVSRSYEAHPANVVFRKLLHRYPLTVHGVHPAGGVLEGVPLATSLAAIGAPVDLVVIAVRAEAVPELVAEAGRMGAGGAIVLSGGFAEVGRRDLSEALVAAAEAAALPVVGPNCLGLFVPGRVDTLFLPPERLVPVPPGGVALVSQSGGFLVDEMIRFAAQGVGVSLALSVGNKDVVDEVDLIEALAVDPQTRVLAFYVEGFRTGEGRRFVEAASRCPKPVVVLKGGRTAAGGRAVASHTASLAGDHAVFSAALAQHGVFEARDAFEMASLCEALSAYPVHGPVRRVGILTGSGGHGALAVDACALRCLAAPEFSSMLKDELTRSLSPRIQSIASPGNPVDLTGSASDDDFVAAARAMAASDEIDAVLALLLPYLPGITLDLGARLSRALEGTGKPMTAYVPHDPRYRILIEGFEGNGVPVADEIRGAVDMLAALRRGRTE